ncbi:peptidase inhibitor family I36 protein [Lentzea sp. NPDC055074]
MSGGKRSISAALVLAAAVLGSVFVAPQAATAAAAPVARNGKCETGEFCLFPMFDWQGSVSDFAVSVPNYGTTQPTCFDFKGPGTGQGRCVKNAALSGYNLSKRTVRLYYNSGYGGRYIDFPPDNGLDGGLGPLDGNNASHKFL